MLIFAQKILADAKIALEIPFRDRTLILPNTWRVSKSIAELCPTLERQSLRATGRDAALILHMALQEPVKREVRKYDPGRVGIYGVAAAMSFDYNLADKISRLEADHLAHGFLRHVGPNDPFRISGCYVWAHIGMHLQVTGPMYNFNHTAYGALHACQQATYDLEADRVDLAILGGVCALDDPFDYSGFENLETELHECAALLLFDRGQAAQLLDAVRRFSPGQGPYQSVRPLIEILAK